MDGAASPERPPQIGHLIVRAGRCSHVLIRGAGAPVVLLHGVGSLAEEIASAFPDVPGIRWIAPDRPGYGRSDPLPRHQHDPLSQARWLEGLLANVAPGRVTLVAHSLAAGTAIAFAATWPDRVERLVLLAPFCRPTREKALLGLRLTTLPVVGRFLQCHVVPRLISRARDRIIGRIAAPNSPAAELQSLPITYAIRHGSLDQTARELKSFNAGMRQLAQGLVLNAPVTAVHGLQDRTALPGWHLPWLRRHCRQLRCILVRSTGHAIHHAAPRVVLQAVLDGR